MIIPKSLLRAFERPENCVVFLGAGIGRWAIPEIPTGRGLRDSLLDELNLHNEYGEETFPQLMRCL